MMKMCKEMMGNMDMDSIMQKSMGIMQKSMSMMGGNGDNTPKDATSGKVAEAEQAGTKTPGNKGFR